ncbi:hypothetical protein MSAN_00149500 [Mycena sanguinolenta]|uniref:Uncharacterized protein n=1 Tax=Mycena sanguinolenta TaxID=230812 RepID=A0A8H7DKZ5_9AGAR|nr:hypothetical protein MSAN_00149500 [Mycena sanguinolenta]
MARSCDALYRPTTRKSLLSTVSDVNSEPSKMRYGGRGGAGSRARKIKPSSSKARTLPQSTSASSPACLKDAPPPVPAIPTTTLAERRGAANLPSPLILQAPSPYNAPDLHTPPLSATTHSTAPDSEYPNTPRTPYFYFDEAFDNSQGAPRPPPNPSGSMTRSLRRLASLSQVLFAKDRSAKAPPPTPALPSPISSGTHDSTPQSTPLTSPSETSFASEWHDAHEEHHDHTDMPETFESSTPHPDPPSTPIVVELPRPEGRVRSTSTVTVKARGRKHTGERKQRPPPPAQGEWNNDINEVIVALRLLK